MAMALQQPAYPGGMGPRFQRNPHPRFAPEMLPSPGPWFVSGPLLDRLSSVRQHAVMAVTVAQIQTHYRQRLALRCRYKTLLRDSFLYGWSPLHP